MGNKLSICRAHFRTKPDIPQGRRELMHCFAVLNSPSGLLHKPVLISPIWKTEYQDIFPLWSLIIKATLTLPEQEGKSTISLFLQIFYFGSCGNLCFASVRVDHWAKQWLAQGTERCTQIHVCVTTYHSEDPTVSSAMTSSSKDSHLMILFRGSETT